MSKNVKNVQSVVRVFTLSTLKLLTDTFTVNNITHMSCYTYNIVHFWLEYNGLAIVRKTTQESRAVAGNPRDAAVIFDP